MMSPRTRAARDVGAGDYAGMASIIVAHGYIQEIRWNVATVVYEISNDDEFDAVYDGDGECFDPTPDGYEDEISQASSAASDIASGLREQRQLTPDEYNEVRAHPLFFVIADSDTSKARIRWTEVAS